MTEQELHALLLDRFNSVGHGDLILEMTHSSGYRYQKTYKVFLSRLSKDGFYFKDYDNEAIIKFINNKHRKTIILS